MPAETRRLSALWKAQTTDRAGKLSNSPCQIPVTLNITDEAGPLQGAMLFYLIRRDEGKPPTSSPGIPEPLFTRNSMGRVSHSN